MLTHSDDSQLFAYLINRVRHDPAGFAEDAGLGSVANGLKLQPPLVLNSSLSVAAVDRIAGAFGGDATGSAANAAARAAGFTLPAYWPSDQNFLESAIAGTDLDDPDDVLRAIFDGGDDTTKVPLLQLLGADSLFARNSNLGVGHRQSGDALENYWNIMAAPSADLRPSLTGVVFDDRDGDGRYSRGEGLANVTVTVDGRSLLTDDAGGWSRIVDPGRHWISVAGGGFVGESWASADVRTDNVELDFVSGRSTGAVNFASWQNGWDRFDVDGDEIVSPADILFVIHRFNQLGTNRLPDAWHPSGIRPVMPDVDGDGFVSPQDILYVIARYVDPVGYGVAPHPTNIAPRIAARTDTLANANSGPEGEGSSSEILINSMVPRLQTSSGSSVSAATGANGAVIVFSGRGPTDDEGVYARRLNAGFAAIGDAFRVNTTVRESQKAPAVAMGGDGEFVVVWEGRGVGDQYGVFGQWFDPAGQAIGGETLVNSTAGGTQHQAAVATNDAGVAVAVWSGVGTGDNDGVFLRRFDNAHRLVGAEQRVNSTTAFAQTSPAVAMSPSGEFVVTWSSRHQDGGDWGIFGQRFAANGSKIGSEFQVNTGTSGNQFNSSVGIDADGNFVIVWSGYGDDGSGWNVFGQRFDAAGLRVGGEFTVNVGRTGEQRDARIGMGADGTFLVTWTSAIPDGSGQEVMGRLYRTLQAEGEGEFQVNSITFGRGSGNQGFSGIAIGSGPVALVAWSGRGQADRNGVFGSGVDLTTGNRLPVVTPIPKQLIPELAPWSFNVQASDADGDTIRYRFGSAAPPGMTIDSASGLVTWTPSETQGPGSYSVVVEVTDARSPNLPVREILDILVSEVNQAPELAEISAQVVGEGSLLTFGAVASDADRPVNQITYRLQGAPPGLTINSATGVVSWTPSEAQGPGSYVVQVIADDNGVPAKSATKSVAIDVLEVNSAPILDPIPTQTVAEQTTLNISVAGSDADLPSGPLSYSLVGAPGGMEIDRVSGRISWTPTEAQGPGTYQVHVVVSDSGTPALSASRPLSISVIEVNRGPSIEAIADTVIAVGSNYSIRFVGNDPDLPANDLRYSLAGNVPTDATLDPAQGNFSWTPAESFAGQSFDVTAIVTDGVLTASEPFRITVGGCGIPASLSGWTIVEAGGTAAGRGTVTAQNCSATIREGDSFRIALEKEFTIPATPSSLQFTYSGLAFDLSDTGSIRDAFEVALVDVNGKPVVQNFVSNRDAFFNATEQLPAAYRQGIAVSGNLVSVGLTGLPAGLPVKLVFRFVNNDSDTLSKVVVGNVTIVGELRDAFPPETTGVVLAPTPVATTSNIRNDRGLVLAAQSGALAPTPAGEAAGFSLSQFARGFPSVSNVGPLGVVFPDSGGALVADFTGNIWRLANDNDGQDVSQTAPVNSFGFGGAIDLAKADGRIYLVDRARARIVELSDGGVFRQEIATNLGTTLNGMTVNPIGDANGRQHLFVATLDGILDIDPVARIVSTFVAGRFDTVSTDGHRLYGANEVSGVVRGYDLATRSLIFESAVIPGTVEGTALGTGMLSGKLYANTNTSGIFEIDLATGAQVQIAGGPNATRGHFLVTAPDGTLLVNQTNEIDRLVPPRGGGFGAYRASIELDSIAARAAVGSRVVISGRANSIREFDEFAEAFIVTVNGNAVDRLDAAGNFFASITVPAGDSVVTFTVTGASGISASATANLLGIEDERPLDFSEFEDISARFSGVYSRTSFDEARSLLHVDLSTRNDGRFETGVPLLVGIKSFSEPTVQVFGADGATPDGIPYFDFSQFVADGRLSPGEQTGSPTISFFNPGRQQFDYELVYFGQLNRPPMFDSVPTIEGALGSAYRYDASARDFDGDNLTFSLPSHPAGMTIDAVTGDIAWTPAASQLGNHEVTARVDDGRGGVAEQRFVVTVTPVRPNRPPVISSSPPLTTIVAADYRYPVIAADADADSLYYRLTSAPTGMNIGAQNGLIEWTSDGSQVGNRNVTVEVTDGLGGVATQSFTICVVSIPGNHAPVFVSRPLTQAAASAPGLVLEATVRDFSVTHPDFERDSLNIVVPGLVGSELGSDRLPTFVGSAGDGAITSAETFAQWYRDVPGINEKTTFQLVLQETFPGSGILYYNNAAFFPIDGKLLGNEGFGHNYHFTMEAHTGFTYRGGERFSFTGDDDVWVYINNRLVVDLGGSHGAAFGTVDVDSLGLTIGATYPFDLFFNERHSTGSTFQMETGIELESNRGYSYTPQVVDSDGDSLHYRLVTAPSEMRVDFSTGTITWHPSTADIGPHTVELEVADGRGGSDVQSFTLTVVANGDGSISGDIVDRTSPPAEPGLTGWFVYLDQNQNGLRDGGENFTTSDGSGGYHFNNLPAGTYYVRQEVRGGWQQTFPLLDGTGPNLIENGSFELPVADREFEQLTTGDTTFPGWVVTTGAIDAHIRFWQASDGVRSIDLDGSPGVGGIAQTIATIPGHRYRVSFDLGANFYGPPVIKHLLVSAGTESAAFEADASGRTPEAFNWERKEWEFTAVGSSTVLEFRSTDGSEGVSWGAAIDNIAMRDVTGTVTAHVVTLVSGSVVDGRDFHNIRVGDGRNQAPRFESQPPTTASPGNLLTYAAEVTDPENDRVSFDLPVAPDGMTVHPQLGTLVWLPTLSQVGTHQVLLRAKDSLGNVALQPFSLAVGAPNSPPVFVSAPPNIPIGVGLPIEYQVAALDADNDVLSYVLDVAPDRATLSDSVDPLTGQRRVALRWTPDLTQVGSQRFALRVSDGHGGEAVQEFNVTVATTVSNSMPVIRSTPRRQMLATQTYLYVVDAFDPDFDPQVYSLDVAPAGMRVDERGAVTWSPGAGLVGEFPVSLRVSDGRGGTAIQTFQVDIVAQLSNSAPYVTSNPPSRAALGQSYRYDTGAFDPDGDPVRWSLESGPLGMSIDPEIGSIRWVPAEGQSGEHAVTLRVQDALLGSSEQRFTVSVCCNNAPPTIESSPLTTAVVNQPYLYAVRVEDEDRPTVQLSLDAAPAGMRIQAQSGNLIWVPSPGQEGAHAVIVRATDSAGAIGLQVFTVVVSQVNAPLNPDDPTSPPIGNRAPLITSNPVFNASVDGAYEYAATATDPDGDSLRFELGQAPAGMSVHPQDGLIEWRPLLAQLGTHVVTLVVRDAKNAVATQSFVVTVQQNLPPRIDSQPVRDAMARSPYRYTVLASDPERQSLSYTLTQSPPGMTIDSFGRILWTPDESEIGRSVPVTLRVTDSFSAFASQSFDIAVAADTEPPVVSLVGLIGGRIYVNEAAVDVDQNAQFRVAASDNVAVVSYSLTVDGAAVTLDSARRAVVRLSQVKDVIAIATVRDAAGNESSTRMTIHVGRPSDTTHGPPPSVDPADHLPPIVEIASPATDVALRGTVAVIGTVDDPEDRLWYWKLYYARADLVEQQVINLADSDYHLFGEGTQEIVNGRLGDLDTSLLSPDLYLIVLAGFDLNGQGFVRAVPVSVVGNAILGNFALEFTDLDIPLAGIPIQITRRYDTLQAGDARDFGYGWSLGGADPRIRETVPQTGDGILTTGAAFTVGTRVFINNPDGKRVSFTFQPEARSAFLLGTVWYPKFVPDPGVNDSLEVDQVALQQRADGSFALFLFGFDYNPDVYRLTPNGYDPSGCGCSAASGGRTYEYHQQLGLQKITEPNGNSLEFRSDGIFHSSGASIQFVRDWQGRITQIVDPSRNVLRYAYDLAGDLRSVTNQENLATTYVYRTDRKHYLDEIRDPEGRLVSKSAYDANGRLSSVTDAVGNVRRIDVDLNAGVETVFDGRGNPTQLTFNERGNVTRKLDPEGGETLYEYNDPRNPDKETKVTDTRHFVTETSYDERGNALSVTTSLGVTRFTYNLANKVMSVTDANGNVTSSSYDDAGNLLSVVNALGDVERFTYDSIGRRVTRTDVRSFTYTYLYPSDSSTNLPEKVINPDGSFVSYAYNQYGQPTLVIDEEGKRTEARYDKLGRITHVIDGLGKITQYIYVGQNLDRQIDPDLNVTSYEYFADGKVKATIDPENGRAEYTYNGNGDVETVKDPVGNVTTFKYDKNNFNQETIDPLGHSTFYDADSEGNLVETTDRDGRRRTFKYDQANHLTEETWWDGSSVVNLLSYFYDPVGNMLTANDNDSRLAFHYDALNRQIEQDNLGTPGATRVVLTSRYDAAGNVIGVSDNLGNSEISTYDYRGNLDVRTWATPTQPNIAADYDYFLNGKPKLLRRSATGDLAQPDVVTTFGYDNRNLIASLVHGDGTGAVFATDILTRYDNGLVKSSTNVGATRHYGYNKRGELTSVTSAGSGLETFAYDANGSRLFWQNGSSVTNYTIAGNNRYSQYVINGTLHAISYYDSGAIKEISVASENSTKKYEYDYRGRLATLVVVENGTITTTTTQYDALDRPNVRVADGVVAEQLHLVNGKWGEVVNSNTMIVLNGASLDENVGQVGDDASIYWYLLDHQLSSIAVIAQGTAQSHFSLTAFGSVDASATDFGILFLGRPRGPSDQYDFRTRTYLAQLGRFGSEDPSGFSGNDWSLYRAMANSPLSFRDPYGLASASEYVALTAEIYYGIKSTIECMGSLIDLYFSAEALFVSNLSSASAWRQVRYAIRDTAEDCGEAALGVIAIVKTVKFINRPVRPPGQPYYTRPDEWFT